MKIVQVGDIHISESRIQEFEEMLKNLADKIIEQKPDLIVCTGDLFIHRDKLTPNQVSLARTFFKEYLKDFNTIVIVGNHDISMSENKVDSISAIFTLDDVKIFTEIGTYIDIENYRFHMFSYPSKKEFVRLGLNEFSDFLDSSKYDHLFNIDSTKKNILVYHGCLEDFNISDYAASAENIAIGKDVIIPKKFWSKFDCVMAGHLHAYQAIGNAIYAGAPFPLTYADVSSMGFVVWDNLNPSFVEVPKLFPYLTYNMGQVAAYENYTEFYNTLKTKKDHSNDRVRIKYRIHQNQAGHIDHAKLSSKIGKAKEIKIVPEYIEDSSKSSVSIEDFEKNTIYDLILKFIDDKKFHPKVKEVAKTIEDTVNDKFSKEEVKGLHFKVKKLKISNFKCYGEVNPEIDFDKLEKIIGVFGDNKIGKSSLVESIMWGLFGTTLRNKIANTVIRNGEDSATVEIEFESHGESYRIIRTRGKNNSLKLLHLTHDLYVDISGATATVTQSYIEKLVGTFDMFVSTVYSPQGGIDIIVKKKPNERKQIILDCLQIDVLEKRQNEINELKKVVKDEITTEKGRLNAYTDELTSLIAQGPNEVLKELESQLTNDKTELTRITSHLFSLNKRVFDYEDLHSEYANVTKRLQDLKVNSDAIEARIKAKTEEKEKFEIVLADRRLIDQGIIRLREKEDLVAKFSAEQTLNNERKTRLASIRRDMSNIESRYDSNIDTLTKSRQTILSGLFGLKRLDCPKPDCPMNERISEEVEKYQYKLDEIDASISVEKEEKERSLLSVREEEAKVILELENSFYNKEKHLEAAQSLQKERENDWEGLKIKISSDTDILNSLVELIASYMLQRESLLREQSELLEKRATIIEKLSTIDKYKKEIEKAQITARQLEQKISICQNNIYKFKRDLDDISKLQKQILEVQNVLVEKEDYYQYCNKYATIVSKDGVIFSLVDRALPILEKFAQDLITETTNGMVSISLESSKLLSTGEKSDDVLIYIMDSKGKRDVIEGSGSEITLVSLALRAAMSYLLSMRMGSRVELFILDESLSSFDQENIQGVKSLIKKLGNLFNKVLFITHIQESKDIAQSVIKVTSDGVKSTFTIEGLK